MLVSTLGLDGWERDYLASLTGTEIVHRKLRDLSSEELSSITGVFSYGYDLKEDTIRKMPSLRWIHIGQSGMEYLPFAYIKEREIKVTNSRGINASNISEHILCSMLNHARKTSVYADAQKRHEWDTETRMGELRGSVLAVLGLGMAGREVVKRALAFDMKVYGMDIVDVHIDGVEAVYKPSAIKEILSKADYIALTMPLTKDTHHIINRESLSAVKKGAYLINTGRGGLVDIEALKDAIRSGNLSGASLDVFDTEPLNADSELWSFDESLTITPHIAGDHFSAYGKRMIEVMARNINAYPEYEKMINKVNIDSLV